MKILKPLIASVMASVSLVGLAQSDFSQVGLTQPEYKYEKPAGADNFYHTYLETGAEIGKCMKMH